ncbi:MAG TPA: hypothetical protein VKY39_09125 [Aggregatilineales bacterium]|nr:hypothetical protein [Aggregatilineales bacterium]
MYANNEILFPNYVIPVLRDMRGPEWRDLVDRVIPLPNEHPEKLAFVLMMIRLNGCLDCETDSYRALRGCAMCATQTLRRFKGPDQELLDAYATALADVREFLAGQQADEDLRIA